MDAAAIPLLVLARDADAGAWLAEVTARGSGCFASDPSGVEPRAAAMLRSFGRALILDLRSPPGESPTEASLGYEAFHDPTSLRCEIAELCRDAGFPARSRAATASGRVPAAYLGVDPRLRWLEIGLRRGAPLWRPILRAASRYAANERGALYDAFARTEFRAEIGGGRVAIRIGATDALLEALLDSRGASSWAYVTAWNPRAQALLPAENALRHDALVRGLEQAGLRYFEGEGVGEGADWTPERSVLILGISETEALALGECCEQEAIVVGERGQPARLRFCAGAN